MRIHCFSAGILVAALTAGLPIGSWADEKADFETAMAGAQEARKKAAGVGGEWRDVGKLLKKAEAAAKDGDYAKAIKLAETAKKQGELGYEQAMSQKGAGLPDYMIAGSGKEPVAGTAKASTKNKISAEVDSVEVMHKGEKVVITRGNDSSATLPEEFLKTVAEQTIRLRKAYVNGPYTMVINQEVWKKLVKLTEGYPFTKQLKKILDGKIIVNHNLSKSLLISEQGGDYELVIGQDISIGYDSHDSEKVKLYFTESFTFRILSPEAIIVFN